MPIDGPGSALDRSRRVSEEGTYGIHPDTCVDLGCIDEGQPWFVGWPAKEFSSRRLCRLL
jgi:hypothetical protein